MISGEETVFLQQLRDDTDAVRMRHIATTSDYGTLVQSGEAVWKVWTAAV